MLRNKQELEEAHNALQSTERLYRGVFDSSSDAILVLDRNQNLVAMNVGARKLFGTETVPQKGLASLVEKPVGLLGIIAEVESGKKVSNRSLVLTLKNEKNLITLVTVSTGFDGDIHVHIRDITKETKLESQMKHAQKMEAVGTLAGGIAHDFNNLLSPIILHSQMATAVLKKQGSDGSSSIGESLSVCEEAATKAASLVKELLQFARKPEDEEGTTDLRKSCRSTIRLLRSSIPSNIQIRTELPEVEVPVRCSVQQFEMCLTNLGINASHAIGTSTGEITVSLQPAAGKQDNGKRGWQLKVSDTGSGMDAPTCQRIFEPFFTTKGVGKGSGLGLAMVHGFIESAKGEIEVESVVGEGTTFSLFFPESQQPSDTRTPALPASLSTLPATSLSAADRTPHPNTNMRLDEAQRPEKAQRPEEVQHPEEAAPTQQLLLVDDDPLVLKAVAMVLQRRGYAVTTTNAPKSALELLSSQTHTFDLVVTDQMMPEMTGIELAREIRGSNNAIPIILLTGFCDSIFEDQASEVVNAIHMKPLDYGNFHTTIQSLTSGTHQKSHSEAIVSN